MITKEEQLKNIDEEIINFKRAIADLEYYKEFIKDIDFYQNNIDEDFNNNVKFLFALGHPKKLELYYSKFGNLFCKTISTIKNN